MFIFCNQKSDKSAPKKQKTKKMQPQTLIVYVLGSICLLIAFILFIVCMSRIATFKRKEDAAVFFEGDFGAGFIAKTNQMMVACGSLFLVGIFLYLTHYIVRSSVVNAAHIATEEPLEGVAGGNMIAIIVTFIVFVIAAVVFGFFATNVSGATPPPPTDASVLHDRANKNFNFAISFGALFAVCGLVAVVLFGLQTVNINKILKERFVFNAETNYSELQKMVTNSRTALLSLR